jgi:hypothetical protein
MIAPQVELAVLETLAYLWIRKRDRTLGCVYGVLSLIASILAIATFWYWLVRFPALP